MNIPPSRLPSLLLPALALLAGVARAQGAPGPIDADTLARASALAAGAARALAPAGARIDVQPGVLDPRLTLAPCARIDPYLPAGAPSWGRTRVGLRCTQGTARWNVTLPLAVRVFAPALVPLVALPPGARLSEEQLALAEAEWSAAPQAPFADARALAGRTLARAVAPGQALRAGDLAPRQYFAIGDTVQVRVTGQGFSIAAEGQALSPGLEGRPARVRVGDDPHRRVVVGQPAGERRLEVML